MIVFMLIAAPPTPVMIYLKIQSDQSILNNTILPSFSDNIRVDLFLPFCKLGFAENINVDSGLSL